MLIIYAGENVRMNRYKLSLLLLLTVVLTLLAVSVHAQEMAKPSITVSDQVSFGSIDVASIYSEGPGWVVIHTDGGSGPGIGQAAVAAGWTFNLRIPIDATKTAASMSAMLHVDDGEAGKYEFGAVEGKDNPILVDGQPINPTFNVQVIRTADQFLQGNQIRIASVTVPVDSWVVVHQDDGGKFGGVLGQTLVKAGRTANVLVFMKGDITPVLWPMLHIDNGEKGKYEFNGGEIDAPVVIGGQVASEPIWTVPHIRMLNQIALQGDNHPKKAENTTPEVVVAAVLSQGAGFLVIHQDDNGKPGGVAGVSQPLRAGLTANVRVALDASAVTPVLWPMLHVDDGVKGKYEFGTVEGKDAPVLVGDQVVTIPVQAAPSIVLLEQKLTAMESKSFVSIRLATMDAPGWIALHKDDGGKPGGEVIATALVHPGRNWNVMIEVDPAKAGERVWPMLHYDTGELGKYEFGAVEGADAPVLVGSKPVVPELKLGQ
jgi:hypothetical protein